MKRQRDKKANAAEGCDDGELGDGVKEKRNGREEE